MRVALAANASAHRDTIDLLLAGIARREDDPLRARLADAVLGNASVTLWLLLDPRWLARQPAHAALALAASPALTPVLWGALADHPALTVRLRLLRSPAAPADALARLGLGAAALALRDPTLTDEDVLALARTPVSFAATELTLGPSDRLTFAVLVTLARSTAFPALRRLALANDIGLPFHPHDSAVFHDNAVFVDLPPSTTLGQLRGLVLSGPFAQDEAVQMLVRSRALAHLEELSLDSHYFGQRGLLALATWPGLASLRRLTIGRCGDGPAKQALREAAARHPGLALVM
ncbi:MAG: hypothetical protein EOO75_03115 [Myxococcales bacterium]|nr:MAG: hypothetical protein EOO75_03115 [Myxococcales bacterium]